MAGKPKFGDERKFKVIVQGVKQKGEFTATECGQKLTLILNMYGSTDIQFIEVEPDLSPSGGVGSVKWDSIIAEQIEYNIKRYEQDKNNYIYIINYPLPDEILKNLKSVLPKGTKFETDRIIVPKKETKAPKKTVKKR